MQLNLSALHVDVVFQNDEIVTSTHGGVEFSTDIASNAGGYEQRNANFRHAVGRWELGQRAYSQATKDYIQSFFRQRRGRYQSFLWLDLSDFTAPAQPTVVQNYLAFTTQGFVEIVAPNVGQLVKQYTDGTYSADRYIFAPIATSLQGLPAGFSLGANGAVSAPGATVGAQYPVSFDFHTPVRFDADRLDLTLLAIEGAPNIMFDAVWQLGSLPLVEVRLGV